MSSALTLTGGVPTPTPATFYLQHRGDSMEPEFPNRTLFCIELHRRKPEAGAIFALRYGNESDVFVARASIVAGDLSFTRDNPKYAPITARDVEILGRAGAYFRPL